MVNFSLAGKNHATEVIIIALNALFVDKAGRKPLLVYKYECKVLGVVLIMGCLLAAISLYLKIYEIGMAATPTLLVTGILSDVNNVCFADKASHLIYILGAMITSVRFGTDIVLDQNVRILMGHLEGITFLGIRNDGRYFISKGKDQTIKLCDIRKMLSNASRYVSILLSVNRYM
ncbi:LEC14B protein [Tanacetum coccineum]